MKKVLSLILCLCVVLSVAALPASAATNYCGLFEKRVRSLRWSMEFNGDVDVKEGQKFSESIVLDEMKSEFIDKYYTQDSIFVEVPASVLEAKAKKCFAIVDINALRTHKENFYNPDTEQPELRQVYSAEKNAYLFPAAGGAGDSTIYSVRGYTKNGSKYTVYSFFIDAAGGEIALNAVEGKDYIMYEGEKCPILHSLKCVVETDGTDVKFHSWEKSSTPHSVNGLITPSTKVEDEKPTSSKPTQSSKPTENSTPTQNSKPAESSKPAASTLESVPTESVNSQTNSQSTDSSDSDKPNVIVAETDGVKLEGQDGVFPKDTEVKVEEIKDEKELDKITDALSGKSDKFVAYDISAKQNNVYVQPSSMIIAIFTVPQTIELSRVGVFYVSDDGKTERLKSSVNESDRTVSAELSHFSTYVVAELSDEDLNEESSKPISPIVWIILAVIALAAAAIAAWLFIFKKKA